MYMTPNTGQKRLVQFIHHINSLSWGEGHHNRLGPHSEKAGAVGGRFCSNKMIGVFLVPSGGLIGLFELFSQDGQNINPVRLRKR